jgi:hypothetical protein
MDVVEIMDIRINNSGRKPDVPGNPILAKDIINKKKENTGIELSKPENARIDRVWYLSDNTPTK